LDAARQKALALRAERKLQKQTQPEVVQKVSDHKETHKEVVQRDEEEADIEYVRKAKKAPKKKRIIVVQESSSSEEEVEIRLPKKRGARYDVDPTSPKDARDARDEKFEASMTKLFSIG
jgi:hypothetical protein